jgi:hypothetical protein
VLRGYPIPLVILQEEYDLDNAKVNRRVVDGQQRLRTLISYIDRSALHDLNDFDFFGYTPPEPGKKDVSIAFADLSDKARQRILNTPISAVILQANTGDSVALEVYDRLNSTGLALGNQELRFARRPGPFSELCYRLARGNQRRWSAWRLFREQDIARMREVEFTSELVLLLLDGIERTGKKEIDEAYASRRLTEEEAASAEKNFQYIMDSLDPVFGSPSTPDPIRPFRTRAWFYTVFSAMMFEMGLLDDSGERALSGDLVVDTKTPDGFDPYTFLVRAARAYADVKKSDTDLAKAVSGAASDRRARKQRFDFLRSVLAEG